MNPVTDLIIQHTADMAGLLAYFLAAFIWFGLLALNLWLWRGLFDFVRRWFVFGDRWWQYRVDVSKLGRVVVTRYFDTRGAAAWFMRRWCRVDGASVSVHGERWT